MRARGLTLLELLLAIAVIGLAFGAFLSGQVTSLRASTRARLVSDVKAFAVRVLEEKSTEVLKVESVASTSPYRDAPDVRGNSYWSFHFTDYYYSCPTRLLLRGVRPQLRAVACGGQETGPNGFVADWAVFGERGPLLGSLGDRAEGVVTVVVTARAPQGVEVTVGRRATCYDVVYPSPTHDKPASCLRSSEQPYDIAIPMPGPGKPLIPPKGPGKPLIPPKGPGFPPPDSPPPPPEFPRPRR